MRVELQSAVVAGIAVLTLAVADDAVANSHGGSSASSSNSSSTSSNSGGGSSSSSTASSSAAHSSGTMSGAPHSYSAPRYYSGVHLNPYRPTTTSSGGARTLSYPAVHGTMTPIHSRPVPKQNITGKSGTSIQKNATAHNKSSGGPGAADKKGVHSPQKPADAQVGKWSHSNFTGKSKLDPQTAAQLRHWKGKVDSPAQARQNNREFRNAHHDHHWWKHHCVAIIFFDFGWWGWWDGWWYPAWGYDPYYDYYAYDQPIYGYNGLPPDQVVADVQSALQQLGYYGYAVDGTLGPLTSAAIANYQRDHLLPITGGIDPATLGSLGLIY